MYQKLRNLGLLSLALNLATAAMAAREDLTGKVVVVDTEATTLTLDHEGSSTLLGPGETTFSLSTADLHIARQAEAVRGHIYRYGDGFRIEGLFATDPVSERTVESVNRRLRADTVARGHKVYRAEGENLPPFALYNQDSQVITDRGLRGSRVIMNFIFTRCGMPDMCPASTARMIEIQEQARAAGIDDLRLVTVTFDPEYDTPGILYEYARDRGAEFDNFDLLTGSPRAITDLMMQFGILQRGEGPMMQHTMSTLLIDPKGEIIFRRTGSSWTVEDFMEQLGSDRT